jgi:hypothetical protein
MVSQMADFTSSRAFYVTGPIAFAEAGITHNGVDHLMIYDAFAHLPIYGLEDLGCVPRGEAGAFISEPNTAPRQTAAQHRWRRSLLHAFTACTACTPCGRARARCAAPPPARFPGVKISVCHGVAACPPPPARSA